MTILKNIENYINYFKATYNPITFNIVIAFVVVTLILVVLRIVLTAGYQTQRVIFSMMNKKGFDNSDEIEYEEDVNQEESNEKKVKKPKTGLIGRILDDSNRSVEKGVSNISVDAIVKKNIMNLKFVFWSYGSIENFVISLEQGIVGIGIILALFMKDDKEVYALAGIVTFLIFKAMDIVFNYKLKKEILTYELIEFIEREIVTDENKDFGSTVSKFSKEVYVAIMKQADIMKESIDKMGSNLTGALALSISEMTKAVESSVDKSANFTDELIKPLEMWSESIDNAGLAQEKINLASELLSENIIEFNNASRELTANFTTFADKSNEQDLAIKESVDTLKEVIEEFKETNEINKVDYESVKRQMEYVDKNQSILEQNIQQYQVTLGTVTSNIGESLGEIVDLQMQNSYIRLNDILLDNINIINTSNNETLKSLNSLFEKLEEQTITQTQAIFNIKEQMDMQFDNIREKI